MPAANGHYYGNGDAVYDAYDATSNGTEHLQPVSWKPTANGINGTTPLDVDFHQNGANGTPHAEPQDEMTRHMLYETALLDTKGFSILSIDEVDTLKKELARVVARSEAAQRSLALETKVRDAAQNLQRLYSPRNGARADTPQSPESPKRTRRSLLGQNRRSSGSNGRDSLSNAEEEYISSQKKVEELHGTIASLYDRRAQLERKLLHHTAAILAEQRDIDTKRSNRHDDDSDAVSTYEADEFDGIRDILGGRTINKMSTRLGAGGMTEEQLQSMQARVERLNLDLRNVIDEASQTRDTSLPEPHPADADIASTFDHNLTQLEDKVRMLESKQEQDLAKSVASSQKLGEYESTVHGLWELLDAEAATTKDTNQARSPMSPDAFSLQAFSSRVQNFFDRATSARNQHDILRRQIAQQRELNSKADAEKDRQLGELQTSHQNALAAHEVTQTELTKAIASHAVVENEATQLRAELASVETEFVQLKKTGDDITRERETRRQEMQNLEAEVVRLTTELTMTRAVLDSAYGSRAERAKEAQGEMEGLRNRSTALEKELTDMTNEFQELTRESLQLDRERSQLESLIDGLRERCETLEAQLSDEKLRTLGAKNPANGTAAREQTSMVVIRQEFKKMIRDARAEGIKLLRAEQEERRKLEAELRRLRQANTPIGRAANGVGIPA